GHARRDADVGERAVAVVAEEVVGRALEAARSAHHGLAAVFAVQHAGPVRGAHAKLLVGRARGRTFGPRRGARRGWGRRKVRGVEADVAGDEQVELPVPVVVAERAARGPAVYGHAARPTHARDRAV